MAVLMSFLFRNRLYFLTLLLGICYSSLWHAGFMNFDDSTHFYNQAVLYDSSFRGLWNLFSDPNTANKTFVPLTVLSFMLENLLWGINARLAHLVNVLLFILVVFQVERLGRRMGLSCGAAFMGACVFALHPLHVEPVSWVTARKDVLYGIFYLLSLVFYVVHLQKAKGSAYLVALLCAGLSVLAKSMALSLPVVLLLIRWFMGKRDFVSGLWSLLPFFLVVEPIALITYLQNIRQLPLLFPDSLLVWTWSMSFYLIKFFFPFGLAPVYSAPLPVTISNPAYFSGLFVFISAAVIVVKASRFRWLAFALLFYALSTFFLWRYDIFDLTIVADRFMFIPSIGLCFCAGLALEKFLEFFGFRLWKLTVLALFFCVLAFLTARQVSVWKNSWAFWSRVQQISAVPSDLSLKGRLGCLSNELCFRESRADIMRDCLARQIRRFGVPPEIIAEKIRYFRLLYAYRDYRRIRSSALKARLWYNILRLRKLTGCPAAEEAIAHYARQYPRAGEEFVLNAFAAVLRRDWLAARDYVDMAADLAPLRTDVLALRAVLEETQGEPALSSGNICQAIEQNPDDPVVLYVLRQYFPGQKLSCGI